MREVPQKTTSLKSGEDMKERKRGGKSRRHTIPRQQLAPTSKKKHFTISKNVA
jgi:hypothetical protein